MNPASLAPAVARSMPRQLAAISPGSQDVMVHPPGIARARQPWPATAGMASGSRPASMGSHRCCLPTCLAPIRRRGSLTARPRRAGRSRCPSRHRAWPVPAGPPSEGPAPPADAAPAPHRSPPQQAACPALTTSPPRQATAFRLAWTPGRMAPDRVRHTTPSAGFRVGLSTSMAAVCFWPGPSCLRVWPSWCPRAWARSRRAPTSISPVRNPGSVQLALQVLPVQGAALRRGGYSCSPPVASARFIAGDCPHHGFWHAMQPGRVVRRRATAGWAAC